MAETIKSPTACSPKRQHPSSSRSDGDLSSVVYGPTHDGLKGLSLVSSRRRVPTFSRSSIALLPRVHEQRIVSNDNGSPAKASTQRRRPVAGFRRSNSSPMEDTFDESKDSATTSSRRRRPSLSRSVTDILPTKASGLRCARSNTVTTENEATLSTSFSRSNSNHLEAEAHTSRSSRLRSSSYSRTNQAKKEKDVVPQKPRRKASLYRNRNRTMEYDTKPDHSPKTSSFSRSGRFCQSEDEEPLLSKEDGFISIKLPQRRPSIRIARSNSNPLEKGVLQQVEKAKREEEAVADKRTSQCRTLSVLLCLILSCVGLAGLICAAQHSAANIREREKSYEQSPSPKFTPAPSSAQKVACIDRQPAVRRAFESRGWKVRYIRSRNYVEDSYTCAHEGLASIIWTKKELSAQAWNVSKPWQRRSWLPFQDVMTTKSNLIKVLRNHSKLTGRKMDFLPDSYILPTNRDELLHRLESKENGGDGGQGEPWVVKLSDVHNGHGLVMLGPESPELENLVAIIENDSTDTMKEGIPAIREDVVFGKRDDLGEALRDRVDTMSKSQKDDIIVQRYVCNELTFQGKKFDLRVYFLIASVDPLVVLYHDGALRVSTAEYQEDDFSSTGQHLTNIGRNQVSDNCTVVFDRWEPMLLKHVANHAANFPPEIRRDPLNHIRKQMKSAFAELIASVRHTTLAFDGHRTFTKTEDGFALLGADFILDMDLNVWMTEAQSAPGLGNETPDKKLMFDRLLTSMVDILEEVSVKQMSGKEVLPLENTGDFELVYTDKEQFRYHEFTGRRGKNTCATAGHKTSGR